MKFLKWTGNAIVRFVTFILAACIVVPTVGLVMLAGVISALFGALYEFGKFGLSVGRFCALRTIAPYAAGLVGVPNRENGRQCSADPDGPIFLPADKEK